MQCGANVHFLDEFLSLHKDQRTVLENHGFALPKQVMEKESEFMRQDINLKAQKAWIYAAKAIYATLDPALRRCYFC